MVSSVKNKKNLILRNRTCLHCSQWYGGLAWLKFSVELLSCMLLEETVVFTWFFFCEQSLSWSLSYRGYHGVLLQQTQQLLKKNPLDAFINLLTIHVSFFLIIQTLKLCHHDNSYYIQSDDNYYIARKDYFSPIFASSIEPRNWWCQFSTTIQ